MGVDIQIRAHSGIYELHYLEDQTALAEGFLLDNIKGRLRELGFPVFKLQLLCGTITVSEADTWESLTRPRELTAAFVDFKVLRHHLTQEILTAVAKQDVLQLEAVLAQAQEPYVMYPARFTFLRGLSTITAASRMGNLEILRLLQVILRPDFERIMENAMAGVRRQTEVMETFQLRIAELELALENKLTASTCPETRCEDSSVAAAANRVSLCGPVSSSSSSGAVEQPSIVKPPPPVFPASIQDQMEAHKRQRQAFKIQRRSHREQVLSARESEREKRLSEEGG
ncbi:ANKRD17 [Symbiodinium natans]|uniref:ANKRD17 protein n=1 Tax=Symbiodinium natans TaxID=878477 RepID=A0A812MBQ2_9DINO|nr:ANKRD17 [Symbiodinium natans]